MGKLNAKAAVMGWRELDLDAGIWILPSDCVIIAHHWCCKVQQGIINLLTSHMELRSYNIESCSHTHEFAQLVLPVTGSMEIEMGHHADLINDHFGVYIAPNDRHCFSGSQNNLFLVIVWFCYLFCPKPLITFYVKCMLIRFPYF